MKICVLCPRYPYPEAAGDVLRINSLTRFFRKNGHKIILVSFVDRTSDLEDDGKNIYNKIYHVRRNRLLTLYHVFRALFSDEPLQCAYFYSKSYLDKLKSVTVKENPDLYIAHTGRMVQYIEKLGLRDRCIVELTDALSKTYSLAHMSKASSYKKLAYKIEKKRIRKFEQFVIDNYKKVTLVSEADKEYLGSQKSLYVYPMGINTCDDYPEEYDKNKIVFVGNMRTLQNQDAVIFFIKSVLPKLKVKCPKVRFYIIGAEPAKRIMKLHDGKSIFLTGYVESVEKMIQDACLAVAPVRIAAGIQNKVLIAMANHIPVVLSKTISLGIPELVNEENCFIANEDHEYYRYCCKLMESSKVRNQLANKGMLVVKEHYSWDAVLNGYEVFCDQENAKEMKRTAILEG